MRNRMKLAVIEIFLHIHHMNPNSTFISGG